MVGEKGNPITILFSDPDIAFQIKEKLPHIFWTLNIEHSRGGKIGAEVGSARKWPIIALLVKIFGRENVDTSIPIHRHGVDCQVYGRPVQIKTVTTENLGFFTEGVHMSRTKQESSSSGIKALWTGDHESATRSLSGYKPVADIILIQVNFKSGYGLFTLIPREVQSEVLQRLGYKHFFNVEEYGRNSKGPEYTIAAIMGFLHHPETKWLDIWWTGPHQNKGTEEEEYTPWSRWSQEWENGKGQYKGMQFITHCIS